MHIVFVCVCASCTDCSTFLFFMVFRVFIDAVFVICTQNISIVSTIYWCCYFLCWLVSHLRWVCICLFMCLYCNEHFRFHSRSRRIVQIISLGYIFSSSSIHMPLFTHRTTYMHEPNRKKQLKLFKFGNCAWTSLTNPLRNVIQKKIVR